LDLAPVGLQVGIDTFVVVALELFGLVIARRVHGFPRAVVQFIRTKDGRVVVRVIPGNIVHLGCFAMTATSVTEAVFEEFQGFGAKFEVGILVNPIIAGHHGFPGAPNGGECVKW
jgi:hypothetical protein